MKTNSYISLGGHKLSKFGHTTLDSTKAIYAISHKDLREATYNTANLRNCVTMNEPKLLEDQTANDMQNKVGISFLNASRGTGKIFPTKISWPRSNKKLVIAVVPPGIAVTQLPCGHTAHSAFKLPLN